MKFYTINCSGLYLDCYTDQASESDTTDRLLDLCVSKEYDFHELSYPSKTASSANELINALSSFSEEEEEALRILYSNNCLTCFTSDGDAICYMYPYSMTHQEIDESLIEPSNVFIVTGLDGDYGYAVMYFFDLVMSQLN